MIKREKAIKEIYEKIEKTKKDEKTRISIRRKAQKKGKSIATEKRTASTSKPVRQKRKPAKKRASVR